MVILGYIVLVIGVVVFSFGVLNQFYRIDQRIDELEERWVFNDICSRR